MRNQREGEKGDRVDGGEWLIAFEAYLSKHYLISIDDTGLTSEEMIDRYGDLDPGAAVERYAAKYDLRRNERIFGRTSPAA